MKKPTLVTMLILLALAGHALAQVDLKVKKNGDGNKTPNTGDVVTYKLKVANNEVNAATGVKLLDVLPVGVTFLSASGDGTYDPMTGIWDVGFVAATGSIGFKKQMNIIVRVDHCAAATNVVNTVSLSAVDQTDINTSNNTYDHELRVKVGFTVINTDDAGRGSLRKAITKANANVSPIPDTIRFCIPGPGPHTIAPLSELPEITDPVVIDGLSQPGASCTSWPPTLLIELDGTNAGASANGLTIGAAGSGSTIRGLAINRFSGNGIELSGSSNNMIECNFIGTNVAGATDLGNAVDGVHIGDGANNVVGGSATDKRNLISGNDEEGVDIIGLSATGNLVQGNYIGTNVAGTAAIPNHSFGVSIGEGQTNTIGGATAAARNVISGNNRDGIGIGGIFHAGNAVRNNFIGVNAAGTGALPNGLNGVFIDVGSTVTVANNVISGNGANGVALRATTGNVVQGNFIGTDAGAAMLLGNGENGVLIGFDATTSNSNTIGGTASGEGNTIAFNGQDGVAVVDGSGNAILGNAIHANGELGIDLGNNGVTANDPGDSDGSPNMLQNFPVLSSATTDAGDITIDGTFNSTPNTTGFRLEFFSNSACDASDHGEGDTFIGFTTVNTNGSGNTSFSVTFSVAVPAGAFITATATDPSDNTSEFSQCVEAVSSLKPFVFLANKITLKQTKQNTPAGDMHANGTITVEKGSPSKYISNLTAVGKITIQKDNKINGNVKSQTSISNAGTINGTKTIGPVGFESLPSLSYSAGGPNKTVSQNGTLTLPPGSYNRVILNSFSKLKLTSGNYYFNELKYNGNSTTSAILEIDLSSGDPVTINVVNNLFLGTEVEIRLLPNGEADSRLVTFNTKQSTAVKIGREAFFLGALNAPNAKVTLDKNSQLRGAMCVKELVVERDCLFKHFLSPGSLPGPGDLSKIAGEEEATSHQPLVTSYQLEQNYPNPFNPSTQISFTLPEAGAVSLVIYNANGQLVKTLISGEMNSGRHSVIWNATDARGQRVASGVYMYVLKAGDFVSHRKLVLMK